MSAGVCNRHLLASSCTAAKESVCVFKFTWSTNNNNCCYYYFHQIPFEINVNQVLIKPCLTGFEPTLRLKVKPKQQRNRDLICFSQYHVLPDFQGEVRL